MTSRSNHDRRLKAFSITPADIAALQTLRPFTTARLPGLLDELNAVFAAWPEIHAALINPSVHRVRLQHWTRVACGDIETGFLESAQALASAFYENHVPGYAVAICHASVITGVVKDLGLDKMRPGPRLFGGARRAAEAASLTAALTKIAWFDLEVLLETYAGAERASRARAMQAMAETIEHEASHAVKQVSELTENLAGIARQMSTTAARTGDNAGFAANAAGMTLSTARTVAGAAEDLTSLIGQITSKVDTSRAAAQRAVVAGRGVHGSIDALSQQAEQIGRVADMIAAIAGRTNLLALNATIEAARAGDAGKGFAVVASEVKQLATQTARSTEEITRQINAVRQATEHAEAEVERMVAMIGEIDSITTAVFDAVQQQGGATAAINASIGETTGAASQMADRTAEMKQAATETDQQAGTVLQTTETLETAISALRQSLIRTVRTSSSVVNRRQSRRVAVDLPARIKLEADTLDQGASGEMSVRLADLSETGAMLRGLQASIANGTRGHIAFEGIEMRFEVIAERPDRACSICLMPTQAAAAALASVIGRHDTQRKIA